MYLCEHLPDPRLRPLVYSYGSEETALRSLSNGGSEGGQPPGHVILMYYPDQQERPFTPFSGAVLRDVRSLKQLPPGNGSGCFYIRFRANRLPWFFPDVADDEVFLRDCSSTTLQKLYAGNKSLTQTEKRVRQADRVLLRELNNGYRRSEPLCQAFLLVLSQLRMPINHIGDHVGMSNRHLRRLFLKNYGLSPKVFQRIVRICTALDRLDKLTYEKLSDVAYDCGYYDQMHFIRECKHFTGRTPGALLSRQREEKASHS